MAKFIVMSNASNHWDSEMLGILGFVDFVDTIDVVNLANSIIAYCRHAIDAQPGALEREEVLLNVTESQLDQILNGMCIDVISEVPLTHVFVCTHTEDTDGDDLTHLYAFIKVPE